MQEGRQQAVVDPLGVIQVDVAGAVDPVSANLEAFAATYGVPRTFGTLEEAIAKGKLKGALARAYKGAALTIPADLPQRIEAALTRAFTDRLGLEMKSGKLLVGSDRIAENARGGMVAWLAHASDAGLLNTGQ